MDRRTFIASTLAATGIGALVAVSEMVSPRNITMAARRPTPTPRPVRCPGQQTAVGGVCQCIEPKAPGPFKCGPDCCWSPEACCDNACCAPGSICDPTQEEVCIPLA